MPASRLISASPLWDHPLQCTHTYIFHSCIYLWVQLICIYIISTYMYLHHTTYMYLHQMTSSLHHLYITTYMYLHLGLYLHSLCEPIRCNVHTHSHISKICILTHKTSLPHFGSYLHSFCVGPSSATYANMYKFTHACIFPYNMYVATLM